MVNLNKAAYLIKNDGLFTFIYNEMKELTQQQELSEEEILELLQKEPKFLEDYKELNTQSEISNIQLKKQPIHHNETQKCQEIKKRLNENIDKLIALEAFEKPADSMVYVVWIGSLTIFLIFVVHNLIALYTFWYEHYRYAVFGSYFLLILGGFFYYKKMIKKHSIRHQQFETIKNDTLYLIQEGIEQGCLDPDSIYD